MTPRIREHLLNNIVGYVALVVALSGSAYAATSLPRNSVPTKAIKKRAVTGPKLATNAVTGRTVRNGSLTGADLNLARLGTVPSSAQAATAGNADQLGGSPPSAFVKAADAIPGGSLTGSYAQPALADNAVGGAKVADGSLTAADIAGDSLTGNQINEASLNGGNADTVDGDHSFNFAHSLGTLRTDTAVTQLHTGTAPDNQVIVSTPWFQLRAAGVVHEFKLCSTFQASGNQSFIIAVGGGRTIQTIAGGAACGAAINTFGSGTTIPGDFTVFAPNAVIFGTPSTIAPFNANAMRYHVIAIGSSLFAAS